MNQTAQAQFLVERSVNELQLLLSGDDAKVAELAASVGLSNEHAHQILHHFNPELGVARDFELLNTMLRDETLPALTEVMKLYTNDNPEVESAIDSTRRQLASLFEEEGDRVLDNIFGGENSSSSSSSSFSSSSSSAYEEEGDYHSFPNANFRSFINDPKKLDNLVRKMAGQGGIDLSHLMKEAGVPMRHHHRKHSMIHPNKRKSFRRLKQHIRRVQLAPDAPDASDSCNRAAPNTCNVGCDYIADETQRKICNCRDLLGCTDKLGTNDIAVLFSRGLVDSEAGTIEVEKIDYSDIRNGTKSRRK